MFVIIVKNHKVFIIEKTIGISDYQRVSNILERHFLFSSEAVVLGPRSHNLKDVRAQKFPCYRFFKTLTAGRK